MEKNEIEMEKNEIEMEKNEIEMEKNEIQKILKSGLGKKYFNKEQKAAVRHCFEDLYSNDENKAYRALMGLKKTIKDSVMTCNFLASEFSQNKNKISEFSQNKNKMEVANMPFEDIFMKSGLRKRDAKRDHSQYFEDMNILAQQGRPFAKEVISSLEGAAKKDNRYEGYLNQIRRKPFSKEEDDKLKQLVEASKNKITEGDYWYNISLKMSRKRTARQCKERWCKYLDPNIIIRTNWTPEKDNVLRGAVGKYGMSYKNVPNLIPGASPIACKNRYIKLQKQYSLPNKEENYEGNLNFPNKYPTSQSTNPDVRSKVPLPSILPMLKSVEKQMDLSSSLNLFKNVENDFFSEQQNQQQDQGPTPNFD